MSPTLGVFTVIGFLSLGLAPSAGGQTPVALPLNPGNSAPPQSGRGPASASKPATRTSPAPAPPAQPKLPATPASEASSINTAPAPRTLSLRRGWDMAMQGGTGTLRELGMILNGFSTADTTLSAPPDHPLYEKVTYLMSLKEAVAALGLDQATAQSQSKVVCPGFPRDSFRYVSYDGIFEGVYNRIDLVDGADQVVALQLVDERPKSTSRTRFMLEGDWMTYDFIGYRLKAIDQMKVKYDPCIRSGSAPRWHRIDRTPLSHDWTKASVLRVDCVLENKDGKAMEQTRWYVPKPLGNLILFCIQKNGR